MTEGAAGFDLFTSTATVVQGRKLQKVPTWVAIKIPPNTVDVFQDYTGEIQVVLFNHGDTDYEVTSGDRVAQLVIIPIITPTITHRYPSYLPPKKELVAFV